MYGGRSSHSRDAYCEFLSRLTEENECFVLYETIFANLHEEPGTRADTQELDVVNNRATERCEIVTSGMIVSTEEHDVGPRAGRHELESSPLEPSLSLGLVWDLNRAPSSKGFDNHGTLTGIASVTNSKRENILVARHGAGGLRDDALPSCNKLYSTLALGDGVVVGVDVLDGLQGDDHPAGKRGVIVFDVRRDQDSP
ncbi:hypothetical protein AKJ16_DCAP06073 [Drosera capensis]